jgi:GIY-YIG catalytic domain
MQRTFILYLVVNQITGKKYVGLTGTTLNDRRAQHEYEAKAGRGHAFQSAIRKHGTEAFKWYVIGCAETREQIAEQEVQHIKFYKRLGEMLYNLTDGGESFNAGKTLDITHRLRIKASLKRQYEKKYPPKPERRWVQEEERREYSHSLAKLRRLYPNKYQKQAA